MLDTHVGSASSLIAYHRTGVRFVGFEIDTEMYEGFQCEIGKRKSAVIPIRFRDGKEWR